MKSPATAPNIAPDEMALPHQVGVGSGDIAPVSPAVGGPTPESAPEHSTHAVAGGEQPMLPGMGHIKPVRPTMEHRGRESLASTVQSARERVPRVANAATHVSRLALKTVGLTSTVARGVKGADRWLTDKVDTAGYAVRGVLGAKKAVVGAAIQGIKISGPAIAERTSRAFTSRSARKAEQHGGNATRRREELGRRSREAVAAHEQGAHPRVGMGDVITSRLAGRSTRKHGERTAQLKERVGRLQGRAVDLEQARGRFDSNVAAVRDSIASQRRTAEQLQAADRQRREAARARRASKLIA